MSIDFTSVFARYGFHDSDFIQTFNKLIKDATLEQARQEMQERYDNRKHRFSPSWIEPTGDYGIDLDEEWRNLDMKQKIAKFTTIRDINDLDEENDDLDDLEEYNDDGFDNNNIANIFSSLRNMRLMDG